MREQEQRSATQPRRYTNRTSERIVQRMRAREALGQEQAVEEDAGSRLYRAAIESERKRQDRARQAAEEHCHTPKVAPHSASLPRQGDVSERLYGLAQKRALKSAIRRQAREVRKTAARCGCVEGVEGTVSPTAACVGAAGGGASRRRVRAAAVPAPRQPDVGRDCAVRGGHARRRGSCRGEARCPRGRIRGARAPSQQQHAHRAHRAHWSLPQERRARRAQRVEAETRRQARVPLSKRSEALGGGCVERCPASEAAVAPYPLPHACPVDRSTGSARERLTRPIGTVRASTMATVQAPSFRPATSASRGGSGAASPARRQERPRPGTAGSSAHGAQRRGSGRREGRPYEKGGREAGSGRSHSIARGQLRGREGARTREGSAHHARRSASVGASSRKAPAPAARASARQNLTEAFEAGMDRDGDGEEDEEERGWDGDGGADKPPHSPVEALLSSSADPESLAEALVAAERARMSSKRRHREEEEEEAPASSAGVRRSEPRVPETRFADRSEEGGAEEAPAPRGRRSRPDADERGGGVPKPSGHGSPPPRNRSAGAARLFTAGREWQERRERALEAARREKEVKEANECTFRPNARGRPQRPQRRPPPRPKASGGAPSSDAAANVTPRHAAATGAREVLERARSRREGERGSAVRSAEPAAVAPSHVVDPGDTAVASDPGQWSEHVTEDGYLYCALAAAPPPPFRRLILPTPGPDHNDLTGKVQWTRPQGVASQYA